MSGQAQKPLYVCTDLVDLNGLAICKTWQKLEDQPFLPKLTPEQASDLTNAILYVLLVAFGWSLLIKMVKSYEKRH